eukprot:3922698-Prymnesium_polylepis.2
MLRLDSLYCGAQVLGSGFRDLSGEAGPICAFDAIGPAEDQLQFGMLESPVSATGSGLTLVAATRIDGREDALVCRSPQLLGAPSCSERGSPFAPVQVRVAINGREDGLSPKNGSGGLFSYVGES